jgi:beta-xylosidase
MTERVEALLAQMTVEEKVAQLHGIFPMVYFGAAGPDPAKVIELSPHGVGHLCMGGNLAGEPGELVEILNSIQRVFVEETRLGIPAMVHNEALNGFAQDAATNFPTAIGLAATWRPDSVEAMASVASREARAVGVLHVLSPVLDVARDARWGRTHETYGEDPHLCAAFGVSFVRGMQQGDLTAGVISTGKHFLGYSFTEGGLNQARSSASGRELYEVFALPFEAAIRDAGLGSIMNSYSEIDGEAPAGSVRILTELLRDTLGFEGAVVADYSAVERLIEPHHVAANAREAGILAVTAGLDVELPTRIGFDELPEAVATGEIEVAIIDQATRRVLAHKDATGLLDEPFADPVHARSIFALPESVALARAITDETLVLVENDGVLPLAADIETIAVVGPMADDMRSLFAAYTPASAVELGLAIAKGLGSTMAGVPGGDEGVGRSPDPTLDAVTHAFHTVEEAAPREEIDARIRALYPDRPTVAAAIRRHTNVVTVPGCGWTFEDESGIPEAVDAASGADVAVVVVGEKTGWVGDATAGEGRDRATLNLTGSQGLLVRSVIATGVPTVVVLVSGGALDIAADVEGAAAVLQAWHPGPHGGEAVADALFGVTNPGGKLPLSYPSTVGASPVYHGQFRGTGANTDRNYVDASTAAVWSFGHGRSYTSFTVSDLSLSATAVEAGASVTIECTVTNTGDRSGDEVVQIYTSDLVASMIRPVRQLAGFRRITLEPGESQRVAFEYDTSQLAFLDRHDNLIVEAGEIRVMAGTSSADLPLEMTLTLTGSETLEHRRSFVTPSQVVVGG